MLMSHMFSMIKQVLAYYINYLEDKKIYVIKQNINNNNISSTDVPDTVSSYLQHCQIHTKVQNLFKASVTSAFEFVFFHEQIQCYKCISS